MMPVAFIETEAQNAGCVVETIQEDGRARRKRRYRLHLVERLAMQRILSEAQKLAGMRLYDAWCATMLSPPAVQEVFVDSAPRPDNRAVMQVVRMQAYADMIAEVPLMYRVAVRRLVCDRLFPQTSYELDHARRGLNQLVKHLGY